MADPSDEILEKLQYAIALLQETSDRIDSLQREMDEVKRKLDPNPSTDLLTTSEAADLLGIYRLTLAEYRKDWIEGVHYFPQAKGYKYNRALLEDWQRHRRDPASHQKAIELWLSCQPQNQSQRRKKAS